MIQGYEYSVSGLINFKATRTGGGERIVGHYVEGGYRCFYVLIDRPFQTAYVRAFKDYRNIVVNFTLSSLSTKPTPAGEVIV